jgi:PAS domain S-box-containing protein
LNSDGGSSGGSASLRASQDALGLFFDFAPAAMAMFDRDMCYLAANRRWRIDRGLGDQELLGRNHYEIFPEVPERWREIHRRCMGGVGEKCDEDRLVRVDGSVEWVRWEVHPWRDRDGAVGGLICLSEDITARKAAELAQRDSELRLRTIFDTEPDAMQVVTASGAIAEVNAAGCALLGVASVGATVGRDIGSFIAPEHRAAWDALLRQVVNGARGELDYEIVSSNGARRWVHTVAAPMWDPRLGATALLGITSDITERRRLENQVAASTREIEGLYDHAPCGYHSLNADGIYVRINETELEWLGCRREEVVDKLSVADFFTDEGRMLFRQLYPEFVRTGRMAGLEYEIIGRNGIRRHVAITATAVRDVTGRFVMSRAVMFDIAEQKRLERALVAATDAEQHRLGRDLHDGLGQELTGISLLVSALAASRRKSGDSDAGQLDRLAEVVRHAIASCRGMAHGMLPLAYGERSLVGMLRQLELVQRNTLGANVRFDAAEKAPMRLEPAALHHLYRIAQEAVTNARRHSRGTVIHVSLEVNPSTVSLTIADDGIGPGGADASPAGMGLRIMRARAAMIGGRLSVGPGPQGGTRVAVSCPQPP